MTACGGDGGEEPSQSPSASRPTSSAASPPVSPSPSASRPSRSKAQATGEVCDAIDRAAEAAARGSDGSLPARGGAVMALMKVQSARPYLDEELVRIYDENLENPEKALPLIANWCEENGY
ncbi:hypothetical protein [Actinomadura sediminis]|uniref:HEAT repeat domain-containing protein n=1 Tax=Actinomadura sediminis TaxID=1038904 RepID=A0ABW3EMB1_9ACTN